MGQIIGVIPILATPFNKNGDINFKDYEKEMKSPSSSSASSASSASPPRQK